jgi:hypothetical protein
MALAIEDATDIKDLRAIVDAPLMEDRIDTRSRSDKKPQGR